MSQSVHFQNSLYTPLFSHCLVAVSNQVCHCIVPRCCREMCTSHTVYGTCINLCTYIGSLEPISFTCSFCSVIYLLDTPYEHVCNAYWQQERFVVPKFPYYSHILLCLLYCLLYYPAMLEYYFFVQIAYSYHDLWSLCSRTLCRAFFQLKSIQRPPWNCSTTLRLPLLFGLLLSVAKSCSTHDFNIVSALADVVLLPSTEGYFN